MNNRNQTKNEVSFLNSNRFNLKIFLAFITFTCASFSTLNTLAQDNIIPDLKSGQQMYKAVCSGCHDVSIAPTLRGIINRPIASVDSFKGYSDGLKEKQAMTWTKENLNTFLIDPLKFAPGTLMIQVIPEAQKRADIIAFLEKLPPPRK
ncbi:cytochrome c family protein [Aurantivibrio infirmus]